MAELKVYEAKEIVLPEGLIDKFNELGGANRTGHSWQDMIADMGQLKNISTLNMALAFLFPFKELMQVSGKKHGGINQTQLEEVLFGIAISYALGLGEWDDKAPMFMPELDTDLMEHDRVRLRSGKEYTVFEFMDKLNTIVSTLPLDDVLNKMFPKPLLGKRDKMGKPTAGLFALGQVFQGIDKL